MAETTVNLGMLPQNRGEYSSSATYYKDNIVQYNGSSYICTAAMDLEHPSGITGVAPYDSDPATPNTGWAVFSNDSSGVGEGVYNVSVDHTTDNQPKVYANLSAALNDIPAAKQKGGMEIRFIFNNSDYVVDREEGLTTQPAGTLITSSPTMVDGTYKAAQLLGYFSTLPTATGDSNAVVYYKEVDGTYTTWTITLQSIDHKYVSYRLMADSWSINTNDWSFCGDDVLVENPEWIYVLLDAKKRILAGLKSNGSVEWSIGVPTPVKTYINNAIAEIKNGTEGTDLDGLNKIIAFLSEFSTSDTLKDLLDTKVDKEEGKSLIDSEYAESVHFVENPELIDVKTDSKGNILWAIKANGDIYFGAGVPQQVKDYIEDKISSLSLDEYEDIVSFLSDYLGSDTTLKEMIDGINAQIGSLDENKLDAEGLDPEALKTVQTAENPEFIDVTVDSKKTILEGHRKDGTKVIEADLEVKGGIINQSAKVESRDNPEFVHVETDNKGKILWAIKTDGDIYYGVGVPKQIYDSQIHAVPVSEIIAPVEYGPLRKGGQQILTDTEKKDVRRNIGFGDGVIDPTPILSSDRATTSGAVAIGLNNLFAKCRDYFAPIGHADVSYEPKRKVKILFIGNSVTQDHVGYLSWLFSQLYPDEIDFTIGNFYYAGRTIKDYVQDFIKPVDPWKAQLYNVAHNTYQWTGYSNSKTLADVVTSENWDFISIQAYMQRGDAEDISMTPQLVQWLRSNCPSPFELCYLMPQCFDATYKASTRNAATTIVKENPVSLLFGPYLCMEEAQKYWQVSGVLSPEGDGTHLREGFPVMITGMHLMEVICRRLGLPSKIIKNNLIMTSTINSTLGYHGENGTVDNTMATDEVYEKVQYCSVQGTKMTEAWYNMALNETISNFNN